jgi:hypothetical protein
VSYNATYYELAQRHPEVPRLTAKQKEALAMFAALAQVDRHSTRPHRKKHL